MNLLETRKLVKSYKGRTVVKGVNIQISGEIVGLLVEWSGKTTTFIWWWVSFVPTKGDFRENITKLPMFEQARLGIGYLSQEPSVFQN